MVENSNEEYIENAEHFINSIKTDKEYKEENGWHGYYNKEIVELARILEHILQDYKRVLKENEYMHNELDKQQTTINKYTKENEYYKECLEVVSKHLDNIDYDQILFAIYEYYISKQKVKVKIEELDIEISTCEYADDDSEEYKQEVEKDKTELLIVKKVLQQLLGSDK